MKKKLFFNLIKFYHHLYRQASEGRGGDGAGLLQRQPAAGDQGRGPDLWHERPPHHQRADGRRHRLRTGQEGFLFVF